MEDPKPDFPLGRLHMLNIDDNVPVVPVTQTSLPGKVRRKGSLLVDVNSPVQSDYPSDDYAEYSSNGHGLKSRAQLRRNGTIDLQLDFNIEDLPAVPTDYISPASSMERLGGGIPKERPSCPSANIVIMLVGSRGDIQPYVALGKELLKDGHRVRIATHATFEAFVTGQGLEFFSIGGNPQDLMSYMVKNPGLVPGLTSLANGDIARKRKMLKEMIHGCWAACTQAADTGRPFIADTIIANPPSFAHIHCAEALGIPLLMSFTMPWTPTSAFPHPLVNITQSNAGFGMSNYLSYAVADLLTWQGIGDLINTFRTSTLGLPPLTLRSGPDLLERVSVPWTYCMSPSLVPRPADWREEIDVVGFYFLDLATKYEPSPELAAFLESGPTPIYIGFGSVVVDDPAALSKIIFEATAQASVRAIVSSGWGGLGGVSVPPHIFMIDNIPHDWLFSHGRVAAVVHHGGAGTTAIGLAKGQPTVIVPFFGDQAFWGNMVHRAGAGPKPIPKSDLSIKKLKDGILFALSASAKDSAKHLAERIKDDDGVQRGVESFYRHLPIQSMKCDLDPTKIAVWWSPLHCIKLSAFAAQTLVNASLVDLDSFELYHSKLYDAKKYSPEPQAESSNAKFWSITHGEFSERVMSPWKKVLNSTSTIHSSIAKSLASVQERLPDLKLPSIPSPSSSRTHSRNVSVENPKPPPAVLKKAPPKPLKYTRGTMNAAPSPNKLRKMPPPLVISQDPHQDAWKTDSHREAQNKMRTSRIEQGREAFLNSTEQERSDVISVYQKGLGFTPTRQKLYGEQAERTMHRYTRENSALSFEPSLKSPATAAHYEAKDLPPTPGQTAEDEEAYEQQLERAIQLSLEEYQRWEQARKSRTD